MPQNENDNFSAALNGILSNPEMMSMISSMAQKLKSDGANAQKNEFEDVKVEEQTISEPPAEQTVSAQPKLPDALGALAPLLNADISKRSKSENDRACLLRALKPYMSSGRCEAIEYIIKFSMLSDVLKKLS